MLYSSVCREYGPTRLRQVFNLSMLFLGLVLAGVAAAGPEDPEDGGQWGAVIPWPHIAVSAANLPDGRILSWSGSERETWPTTEQTCGTTWDPATGNFVEVLHPTHNMFCTHLASHRNGADPVR